MNSAGAYQYVVAINPMAKSDEVSADVLDKEREIYAISSSG